MLHHYLRGGALLIWLSLAATVSANAHPPPPPPPPIPQGANEVIGGAIDGQMFVYGGAGPANKPMGIFYRYDPAKNEWASLPSNPVPVHHGAAATIGHKFYVFGGFRLPDTGKLANWYPENKAWVFDLDSQKWSALPDVPTARGALRQWRSAKRFT
jgi:N-acetylneuraminic acid mutarotase